MHAPEQDGLSAGDGPKEGNKVNTPRVVSYLLAGASVVLSNRIRLNLALGTFRSLPPLNTWIIYGSTATVGVGSIVNS